MPDLRPLSPMEHAFWLLGRAGSFNGVNTTRISGPLSEAILRQALASVQTRHPQLRVHITGDPPRFVADDRPLPFRIVERTDDETWRAVEADEINRRYQPGDLLSRVVWVRGPRVSELVISHEHVIADALSAVIMTREIVEVAGRLAAGERVDPPHPFELGPALDRLLRPVLRGWRRLLVMNLFFFRFLFAKIFRRPKKLRLDRKPPFGERSLRVHHRELEPEVVRALHQKARAIETTIQGALGAALLLAAADDLGQPARLGCFSGISMRHHLALGDEMGLYVSQVSTVHRAPQDLWTLAREFKQVLKKTLDYGDQFVTMPMVGMFIPRGANPGARFTARFDQAAPGSVGITNIGPVAIPERAGPLVVDGFQIAVGPSIVAPLVAAVSTFRHRLSFNIVCVDPLLSATRAERLADAVIARLREAAR